MGVYTRKDSPYYWLWLPRPGQRAIQESTRIPVAGRTRQQARRHRKDADEAYLARMADLARAGYKLPVRVRVAGAIRFSKLAEWYDEHRVSTHRGAEREREILATLRAAFDGYDLPALSREVIERWMTSRRAKVHRGAKVSASTVNREVDVLKAILRTAVELGHLEHSPIADMPRLPVVRPKRRLMTEEEEDAILAELAPDDKAMLIMGLDTLVRLGDILDLRREDDHGTALYIRDPKHPGQTEPYEVPVSTRLRKALDAIEDDGPYYFARRRRAKTERDRRNTMRQVLEAACKAAGVPYGRAAGGLTWHWATRRTGATRMIRRGVDVKTVQAVGHWASADIVLEIYSEATSEAARAAVEVPAQRDPKPKLQRVK